MAGKSTYASNRTLEYLLRTGSVYIALFTTLPVDDGSGGVEVSGGGYARKAVAFTAASDGQCVSTDDLIWPQATANWGSVVGFGIYDAETGGNPLYLDQLPGGPVSINFTSGYGDQFMVPAGTLVVQEQ